MQQQQQHCLLHTAHTRITRMLRSARQQQPWYRWLLATQPQSTLHNLSRIPHAHCQVLT